jgi:hypothetical protein
MGQAIIVRGGTIGAEEIRKNQKEVTTGDTVVSLSVFVGEVKDIRREEEVWEVAKGYPGKTINAVYKQTALKLYPNIRVQKDKSIGQPNHHLLSGISVTDLVKLFKQNVQIYTKD